MMQHMGLVCNACLKGCAAIECRPPQIERGAAWRVCGPCSACQHCCSTHLRPVFGSLRKDVLWWEPHTLQPLACKATSGGKGCGAVQQLPVRLPTCRPPAERPNTCRVPFPQLACR